MKAASIHGKTLLDVARCALHKPYQTRNLVRIEAGQKARKADCAEKVAVGSEDRYGNACDLGIPFAATDIKALLPDVGEVLALLSRKCIENLSGRPDPEWNDLALFDVVSGKPRAVHTVEAHAPAATLNVEGRAFPCLGDEVGQNGTNVRAEPQILPKLGPEAPKGRTEVIETVIISHQVAEAFKRDRESEYGRLVELAAARKLLERQACSPAREDVEQCQSAFHGIDTAPRIIGRRVGLERIHFVHRSCTPRDPPIASTEKAVS